MFIENDRSCEMQASQAFREPALADNRFIDLTDGRLCVPAEEMLNEDESKKDLPVFL
jgi:hypothetical protein